MTEGMTDIELREIEERERHASDTVTAILHGKQEWTATIPAQPERDTDLVIGASLADVRRLVAEVRRLQKGGKGWKRLAMQAMRSLTADEIAEACAAAEAPVTICGEVMGGQPFGFSRRHLDAIEYASADAAQAGHAVRARILLEARGLIGALLPQEARDGEWSAFRAGFLAGWDHPREMHMTVGFIMAQAEGGASKYVAARAMDDRRTDERNG